MLIRLQRKHSDLLPWFFLLIRDQWVFLQVMHLNISVIVLNDSERLHNAGLSITHITTTQLYLAFTYFVCNLNLEM